MNEYSYFAEFYDELTYNVDYKKRALYLYNLMESLNHNPGLTLDLACGTGSMTVELKKLGIDIYGVDKSQAMLSQAQAKAFRENLDILFICQDMKELDLFGTINTVVSSLDSLNHITKLKDMQNVFDKVSLFLEKDGYFIFDMNTVYKHEHILSGNTFIYDMPNVYCVWQNSRMDKDNRVKISLDLFERIDDNYKRYEESFWERAYTPEQIETLAKNSGLEVKSVYKDMTKEAVKDDTDRAVYILQKR